MLPTVTEMLPFGLGDACYSYAPSSDGEDACSFYRFLCFLGATDAAKLEHESTDSAAL